MTRSLVCAFAVVALTACTYGRGGPAELSAAECSNLADDDGDGVADCADPACAAYEFCRGVARLDGGADGSIGDAGPLAARPDARPFDAGPPRPVCALEVPTIMRDYTQERPAPDFARSFSGESTSDGYDIVLDTDGKPALVLRAGADTTLDWVTSPATFATWWRDDPAINRIVPITLTFAERGDALVYENFYFFPVDGAGWGDSEQVSFEGDDQDGDGRADFEGSAAEQRHNFRFATEIHVQFTYQGGETFAFLGDDDLFVFVNGELALELGGVHYRAEGTIDFDARAADLGIEIGGTYSMDVFHAERSPRHSMMRIETTICVLLI